MSSELVRGLSKFSTASLLEFIAIILLLAGSGVMISIASYYYKFLEIAQKLSLHLISPSQIPSWFYTVATYMTIGSALIILFLIISAVSAYAFLWPAFSAFSRHDKKFYIPNLLVKIGIVGYTVMFISSIALSTYFTTVLIRSIHKMSPIGILLYIKSLTMKILPIALTLGILLTIFHILTLCGICIGLYYLRSYGLSGLFTISMILLIIDIVLIIVTTPGIHTTLSMFRMATAVSSITSLIQPIPGLIACILIFIACRILKSRIEKEETVTQV